MKTRHIVAIGLLSALAVTLLFIGIKTGKAKTNVFQVHAEDQTETTGFTQTQTYETKTHLNNEIQLAVSTQDKMIANGNTATHELQTQITVSYITPNFILDPTKSNGTLITKNLTTTTYTVNFLQIVINNITATDYNANINATNTTNITIDLDLYYLYNSAPISREYNKTIVLQNVTTTTYSKNYIESNNAITFPVHEIDTYTRSEFVAFQEGVDSGYETGYTTGETTGYNTGYAEGATNGYTTGYTAGYQAKGDLTDGNFLTLRNTMLQVLTMPFTFINQAFNVTLWEGTAYAFNIGSFIKTIIAVGAILFIVKLFTSGFSVLGNYSNGSTDRQYKRSQTRLNNAKANNIGKPTESHVYVHKDK